MQKTKFERWNSRLCFRYVSSEIPARHERRDVELIAGYSSLWTGRQNRTRDTICEVTSL